MQTNGFRTQHCLYKSYLDYMYVIGIVVLKNEIVYFVNVWEKLWGMRCLVSLLSCFNTLYYVFALLR